MVHCRITPLITFVEKFFVSWADEIDPNWKQISTKIKKDVGIKAKAPKTSRNTKKEELNKVQEKERPGEEASSKGQGSPRQVQEKEPS